MRDLGDVVAAQVQHLQVCEAVEQARQLSPLDGPAQPVAGQVELLKREEVVEHVAWEVRESVVTQVELLYGRVHVVQGVLCRSTQEVVAQQEPLHRQHSVAAERTQAVVRQVQRVQRHLVECLTVYRGDRVPAQVEGV